MQKTYAYGPMERPRKQQRNQCRNEWPEVFGGVPPLNRQLSITQKPPARILNVLIVDSRKNRVPLQEAPKCLALVDKGSSSVTAPVDGGQTDPVPQQEAPKCLAPVDGGSNDRVPWQESPKCHSVVDGESSPVMTVDGGSTDSAPQQEAPKCLVQVYSAKIPTVPVP